jgi:hypothetical protein
VQIASRGNRRHDTIHVRFNVKITGDQGKAAARPDALGRPR